MHLTEGNVFKREIRLHLCILSLPPSLSPGLEARTDVGTEEKGSSRGGEVRAVLK